MSGSIFLVGIGPGSKADMTARAVSAVSFCDVICGYDKYIELLGDIAEGKTLVSTGMRGEKKRCEEAIRLATEGHRVAMICSGDAGVYGMSGLIFELLERKEDHGIYVEPVAGVTAATSGAAVLGAPLMNDFAVISLSDQLTPWDKIEKRLDAISAADMVMVLYNPMSHHRPDNLKKACDIILKYRDGDTPCGWVRNIGREGQESGLLSLSKLRDEKLDMLCTVYIGASDTRVIDGRLVTIRGYEV